MKIRNAFATLTIYVLSTLSAFNFMNPQKVEAESITDCRQLVAGTYLATNTANFGSFRTIITFNQDGNFVSNASVQNGNTTFQPFGNIQGSWKCTSDREITATGLDFNYPTATLPGAITRTDFHIKFDPKAGIVQATATLKMFDLNANPLSDDVPVEGTFTFTGLRIKPGR